MNHDHLRHYLLGINFFQADAIPGLWGSRLRLAGKIRDHDIHAVLHGDWTRQAVTFHQSYVMCRKAVEDGCGAALEIISPIPISLLIAEMPLLRQLLPSRKAD